MASLKKYLKNVDSNEFRVVGFDNDLQPLVLNREGLISIMCPFDIHRLFLKGVLRPLDVVKTDEIVYVENLRREQVATFIFRYVDIFGQVMKVPLRGEQIKLFSKFSVINVIKK